MTRNISRNITVDVIRGIAILMVVLGHIITGFGADKNSLIYNVIWSLQMPLFMLISGYVSKFSAQINTTKDLGRYAAKRTVAYLLPLIVWTFLIRGFIFGQNNFFDIKWLVYNMDAGYWFLFSLWTITMMFGISQFAVNCILKKQSSDKPFLKSLFVSIGVGLFSVGLLLIGLKMGLSFLSIKLTLYYTVFYLAGYIYSVAQSFINKIKIVPILVVAISTLLYVTLIIKVYTPSLGDNVRGIIMRMIISFVGCVAVCGVVSRIVKGGVISKGLAYIGVHSLEIYLSHYMFLNLLKSQSNEASGIMQIVLIAGTFLITVVLSLALTWLLQLNKYSRFVLFGKK